MCLGHLCIPSATPNSSLSDPLQPEKLKAPYSPAPPPQEEAFASICPEASASSAFSHSTRRALGPVFSCYTGSEKHRPAAATAGQTEANYGNLNLPWLTGLFNFKCLFVDLQKSNTVASQARLPLGPWEGCLCAKQLRRPHSGGDWIAWWYLEENPLWKPVNSVGNVVQLGQRVKGMKLATEGPQPVKVLQHEG